MTAQREREIEIRDRMREMIVEKSASVLRNHGLDEDQIADMMEEYFHSSAKKEQD